MWQAITQQLSDTLMFEYSIQEKIRLSGGDISEAYMISDGEQRYFVKTNHRNFVTNFELEADNLRQLKQTGTVDVPEVIVMGTTKNESFLVLNYLPTKPMQSGKVELEFADQLSRLHQWGEQKEYGFDNDNYIGATLQPNAWQKKWCTFFSEQRIGWQLQLLAERGISLTDIDSFVDLVHTRLAHHHPTPALLHGDLWNGNVATSPFGPICYDPSSYWGDRECDIAMTRLFGGFSSAFYERYNENFALPGDSEDRVDLYNLYHILNHCNLFGGHYLDQAQDTINRIMSV